MFQRRNSFCAIYINKVICQTFSEWIFILNILHSIISVTEHPPIVSWITFAFGFYFTEESVTVSTSPVETRGKSLAFIRILAIRFDLDTIVLRVRVSASGNVRLGLAVHGPMFGRRGTAGAQVCRVLHAQVCWQQVFVYGRIAFLQVRLHLDADCHRR